MEGRARWTAASVGHFSRKSQAWRQRWDSGSPLSYIRSWRLKTLRLSAVAPLARTPQISLPLATQEGAPVGLGIMGARGADESLLAFAGRFTREAEPGDQLGTF